MMSRQEKISYLRILKYVEFPFEFFVTKINKDGTELTYNTFHFQENWDDEDEDTEKKPAPSQNETGK